MSLLLLLVVVILSSKASPSRAMLQPKNTPVAPSTRRQKKCVALLGMVKLRMFNLDT